ncbi:MAG: 6-phosphogluconolactonase [Candidatus Cryptobacteroides sp.]
MRLLTKGRLEFKIFETRDEMGAVAAKEAAAYIRELAKKKDEINIVFAAAPSQNDFLAYLAKEDLDWGKINAYHMDEYIGLDKDAPQGFGNFLAEHIFNAVPLKSVHYIYDENKDPERICADYAKELRSKDIDIIFMGVGENGHIAFNDPHVAFFDDPLDVKIVDLDEKCRVQQVHDGCFDSIEKVPTHAITLTIPLMMGADRIFVIVPTSNKADAIAKIYNGGITPECPASILRTHLAVTLYTDEPGAGKIG